MLLNLWATWCVPCRKEMPALDALEQRLGGPGFEVVAVNIDTRDADKPKAWLKEVGVQKLAYYADPTARTFQDLKAIGRAFGMPTTLLIDGQGCEIGTIAGPAEWASDDAIKLIKAALGHKRGRPVSCHYTVILRFCPTPAATLARLAMFCWAAFEHLNDGRSGVGVHAQHLGREGHLRAAHLGADHGGGDRCWVHPEPFLRALCQRKMQAVPA